MTKFLIKKFIPDYLSTKDKTVRNSYAFLSAIVGIICNIILFTAKFFIGYMTSSISVITDSFNNLSDVSSSIVILLGFRIANRPPNKNHPFGYGRTEYLSTLIISMTIMYLGYSFFKESIHDIFYPHKLNLNTVSIVILLVSALLKLWLSALNKKLGEDISSKTLIATSIDCRNDVVITSATILSLLFTYFTNIIIDGYVGVFVSLLFLYSGFIILKETISSLLGEPIDKNLISDIKKSIKNYDGILGVHDLIVHNYGPNKIMASIHAEVANDMQINACHDIIERIEKEISRKLNIELVIHADPIAINDQRIKKFSLIVENHLSIQNKELSAHDFRLVDGNGYINFIFDLVIPFEYKQSDIENLKNNLQKELKKCDKKIICVINSETSYN